MAVREITLAPESSSGRCDTSASGNEPPIGVLHGSGGGGRGVAIGGSGGAGKVVCGWCP